MLKRERGFTIFELLVVVSIIALISGIVSVNYRLGGRQSALQRASEKLSQDMRRVQEMAMSLKEKPGGGAPLGGYGVYFQRYGSPGQYNYDIYIYADEDIYADDDDSQRYSAADTIIETIYRESQQIYLEKGVKIKQIDINTLPAACDDENPYPEELHINFMPPDPVVNLKRGTGPSCPQVTITLALSSDASITRTVVINKVGLINTQ